MNKDNLRAKLNDSLGASGVSLKKYEIQYLISLLDDKVTPETSDGDRTDKEVYLHGNLIFNLEANFWNKAK